MKTFDELLAGMYLMCNKPIHSVLCKDSIYKIVAVGGGSRRHVDIRAEENHLFRVYQKDYENGDFEYVKSLHDVLQPTNGKKVMYHIPNMLQLKLAQALRYEIEYLLDSLRISNNLEENEKDFLRLHEINEELKKLDYLVIHEKLEEHITWKQGEVV